MTKKILAGVLAAASILSVSAVASAADTSIETATYSDTSQPPTNGVSYDVSADVTYGTVNCVVPAASAMKAGSVFVNPYGAAITTTIDNVKINNTNFIASQVYTVTNNDTDNGLKVIATASVKKVTGLVIVDGKAKAPAGWDVAVDKSGNSVRVNPVDEADQPIYTYGDTWNPLVSYDKITLTYKDKEKTEIDKAVGGAVSAKQTMNTAVRLVGGTTAADVAKGTGSAIDIAAKGTTGGTLLELDNKTGTNPKGYFTVVGELNPAIDTESYAWGKENLQLSIVLKLIPVANETAP